MNCAVLIVSICTLCRLRIFYLLNSAGRLNSSNMVLKICRTVDFQLMLDGQDFGTYLVSEDANSISNEDRYTFSKEQRQVATSNTAFFWDMFMSRPEARRYCFGPLFNPFRKYTHRPISLYVS